MLDSLCQASELQSHLVKSFITSIASKNYQLTSSCRIQLCDGFIQACAVQELEIAILELKDFS